MTQTGAQKAQENQKEKDKVESLSLENSVQKSRKIVSYIPGCFGIIIKKQGQHRTKLRMWK